MSQVNPLLLKEVDKFAAKVGLTYIITSGYRAGDTGEHGKGLAVDIMFPSYTGSLLDLYLIAERFQFTGIGLYPDWQVNGQVKGGLHLDIRSGPSARWTGSRNPRSGSNEYGALDKITLQKLGII